MLLHSAPAWGGGPVLFGLSTSALWGISDFSGGLAARRTPPALIVSFAHALSFVILIAICLLRHEPLDAVSIRLGLLSGIAAGIGIITLYRALSMGSMGMAAATCGVVTTLIPVLTSWFLEGHAGTLQLAGFALAALAILLISLSPSEHAQPRALWLAAAAGVLFGAMLICMRFGAGHSVLWTLAWTRAASTAMGLGASAMLPAAERRWTGGAAALMLATVIALGDTGGNLFYMLATLAGRMDSATVLSALYPGTTMLLAVLILRERASRTQAAGMVLALAAVALIAL
ncbi:DMT family transporter [Silvibacterium dinghuense]|uniref:DMT family transporter n=1 Tax=Silvibacterium dinghuense TaxID=1560006 RepID=A0A4Q1S928_9BACT|nr:DMT family transporter [Silvibacterium dinghuense]RXS93405.1 DMT family transporter [Silvibacterium dinghuense]GGH05534.1 multidrug transporter [Silvibacterium dinghuense]